MEKELLDIENEIKSDKELLDSISNDLYSSNELFNQSDELYEIGLLHGRFIENEQRIKNDLNVKFDGLSNTVENLQTKATLREELIDNFTNVYPNRRERNEGLDELLQQKRLLEEQQDTHLNIIRKIVDNGKSDPLIIANLASFIILLLGCFFLAEITIVDLFSSTPTNILNFFFLFAYPIAIILMTKFCLELSENVSKTRLTIIFLSSILLFLSIGFILVYLSVGRHSYYIKAAELGMLISMSMVNGILFKNLLEDLTIHQNSFLHRRHIFKKNKELSEEIQELKYAIEKKKKDTENIDVNYRKILNLKRLNTNLRAETEVLTKKIEAQKDLLLGNYILGYNEGRIGKPRMDLNIFNTYFDLREIKYLLENEQNDYISLKINFTDSTSVEKMFSFLKDLNDSYRKLTTTFYFPIFLKIIKNQIQDKFYLFWIIENAIFQFEKELQISKISIQSPGYIEIIGKFFPLRTIFDYLNERHERLKDRKYKNRYEEKKLEIEVYKFSEESKLDLEKKRLELLIIQNEIISSRIKIIESLGLPTENKNAVLEKLVSSPLLRLGIYQEEGLIENAVIEGSNQ